MTLNVVVLGPPAFGALATVFGSYRAGFFALAVATALCTLALLRGRRQPAATGAA